MKDMSRLSDLPEELKLHILGFLDTKQAVQTTILSRSWLSLWTRIPVLQFNLFSFPNNPRRYRKFVKKVLSGRDPLAKLDSLKFNRDDDDPYKLWCRAKFLKRVFDYAFSHGVKHLEASMGGLICGVDSWPVSLCDSLTSLKVNTFWCGDMIRCPLLGPRSVLFKNLTVLYLKRARITDAEPFSGFPVLESLTLRYCQLWTDKQLGNYETQTLKVHALRLSHLTISCCSTEVQCLDLSTPRLRFFKYHGHKLPKHKGLPVLETLEINFDGYSYYSKEAEKQMIDDLMSFFSTIPNIKSLTLFASTVLLLSLFPDELVRRGSPFRELKDLKLDFSQVIPCYSPTLFHKPCNGWYNSVKAYLLHNSPHAEPTLTYPKDIDDMEWLDDDPWKTLLMQLDYPKN